MGNDNLIIEKLDKVFDDKFNGYSVLMGVAGCSPEEIEAKNGFKEAFSSMSPAEKAQVVRDDINFLNFFTYGGVTFSDDSNRVLYDGINKEIAHSVMCTMSSMKNNVEFPKEYIDELESVDTLPNIRDMISGDMSALFPDMKKMFFLGKKEEFHKRMKMVFDNDLETFSDLVDASVKHKSEAGVYQYMDMINGAINKSIGMDFSTKTHTL